MDKVGCDGTQGVLPGLSLDYESKTGQLEKLYLVWKGTTGYRVGSLSTHRQRARLLCR